MSDALVGLLDSEYSYCEADGVEVAQLAPLPLAIFALVRTRRTRWAALAFVALFASWVFLVAVGGCGIGSDDH